MITMIHSDVEIILFSTLISSMFFNDILKSKTKSIVKTYKRHYFVIIQWRKTIYQSSVDFRSAFNDIRFIDIIKFLPMRKYKHCTLTRNFVDQRLTE